MRTNYYSRHTPYVNVWTFRSDTLDYSILAPFYHIRSRERAKYAMVLHSKIMYCPAKSRFPGFLAEGLEDQILTRFSQVE